MYVIQSFNEMDVSDYSWFNKLTSGIPLGCSNYYTVSLVKEKGAAHGGRGGDLNAVIFGKIQFAQLANGKRVKVTGKNRQGRFEVNKLFDCDTGSYIKINSHWSPPGAKGSGNGGTFLLIAIAVIAFLLLLAFGAQYLMNLIGTAGNGVDWQQLLITVAVVVIIIAYLVFTRFQILRAPWMQKIIGVVLLVLILLYVPGGQTILACALMIWVLMKMLSNLFR
ncbi:MAG: hypothetical protein LUI87_13530 [Lachnospiraceae bacterium]|nr:hypothetical protein [Lachnospiraceae bacterium]